MDHLQRMAGYSSEFDSEFASRSGKWNVRSGAFPEFLEEDLPELREPERGGWTKRLKRFPNLPSLRPWTSAADSSADVSAETAPFSSGALLPLEEEAEDREDGGTGGFDGVGGIGGSEDALKFSSGWNWLSDAKPDGTGGGSGIENLGPEVP